MLGEVIFKALHVSDEHRLLQHVCLPRMHKRSWPRTTTTFSSHRIKMGTISAVLWPILAILRIILRNAFSVLRTLLRPISPILHPLLPILRTIAYPLSPDFTWPCPQAATISTTTPAVPSYPSRWQLIARGHMHRPLYHISRLYCKCYTIPFNPSILQLPFGLLLKWTDRVSLEESISMQMARAAGMPVPLMLSCGSHPGSMYAFSILMTRLPGFEINNCAAPFVVSDEGPWLAELRACVDAMRQWTPPHPEVVSSPIGTAIRSSRVPDHVMGPFATQDHLHDFLLYPASAHGFDTRDEYTQALARANDIRKRHYKIVFTHSDFKAHNILLDEQGQHLTGFLDWESAGWQPEYWDFVTSMKFQRDESWWYQVVLWMGGDRYFEEREMDRAVHSLTVDSWIAF